MSPMHLIKCNCKANNQLAIRDYYAQFEKEFNDKLLDHLISKSYLELWKSKNSKFRKNVRAKVTFNGISDDTYVANEFASHFKDVYYDSCTDIAAANSFLDLHHDYSFNDQSVPTVLVDSVDSCIHNLKLGKAGGTDDLMAEHLYYAHPSLNMHLQLLFTTVLHHGFVPDKFGLGIIIPVIKDW